MNKFISMDNDTLLSTDDLVKYFGFSKSYWHNLRFRKEDPIPWLKTPEGFVRYKLGNIIYWLDYYVNCRLGNKLGLTESREKEYLNILKLIKPRKEAQKKELIEFLNIPCEKENDPIEDISDTDPIEEAKEKLIAKIQDEIKVLELRRQSKEEMIEMIKNC